MTDALAREQARSLDLQQFGFLYAKSREDPERLERSLHASRRRRCEGIRNIEVAATATAYAPAPLRRAMIDAVEISVPPVKKLRDVMVYDIFGGTGRIRRAAISKNVFESVQML